jgi:hypothetical protein
MQDLNTKLSQQKKDLITAQSQSEQNTTSQQQHQQKEVESLNKKLEAHDL